MVYQLYTRRGMPLKERLAVRSKPGPSGCIDFIGMKTRGYGRLSIGDKMVLAHRASYVAHIGPIPDEQRVLHKCDRPCCINPAHLWLGTAADNAADRTAKGRGAKAHLGRRGEKHHNAKLTNLQARAIRQDARVRRIIAGEYGVSESAVIAIQTGIAWKHI